MLQTLQRNAARSSGDIMPVEQHQLEMEATESSDFWNEFGNDNTTSAGTNHTKNKQTTILPGAA